MSRFSSCQASRPSVCTGPASSAALGFRFTNLEVSGCSHVVFCVFYDVFWLAPGGVKLKMTKPGPNPRGGEKLIRVFLLRLSASFFCYLHLFLLSASFLTRFPGACHDSGGSVGYMCLFLVVICVFFRLPPPSKLSCKASPNSTDLKLV